MMFLRVIVVHILGKSVSTLPGSWSKAFKEIIDCP
jgi:hypothetical protein